MAGSTIKAKGGRPKGSPNKLTMKGRKKLLRVLDPAVRNMATFLADTENWKNFPQECLSATRQLLEFAVPKWQREDPQAQPAAGEGAPAALPPVTPESILAAFKALPPRPAKPVSSVFSEQSEAGRKLLPSTAPADPSLAQLQHQGIPLDGTTAYLPKPPPMPKHAERGAEPVIPKPAIDAEPVDPYEHSRRPSGCVDVGKFGDDVPIFVSR